MFELVVSNVTSPAVNASIPGWNWGSPPLGDLNFMGLMLINFSIGFLVAFILKRLLGVGIALVLLIVILTLFGGAEGLKYGGVVDEALPAVAQYTGVLYRFAVAYLPWSFLLMVVGAVVGLFGFVTPSFHRRHI